MNYKDATGKSIDESFKEYHEKNPIIYEYFKEYLREVVKAGKKKTSAKMILNRIRWEIYIKTNSEEEYKINDAFTSRYARLFADEHPDYEYLFNFRKLRTN
jgi:hypothetical protein